MPGLDVHLVTPEREVWAGEADFVIARSVAGDLGILPGHAPTLAALDVGAVYIEAGGERTPVAVDGGFLHIGERGGRTRVDLLAEHAVPQAELDGEDLAASERAAGQLREEGRFAEARAEDAKVATRRRLGAS
ncbi:MAG TPA: ATP synthase F1 subunit epsilon [Actinomycetes bacterium]|jgi:F-type H+-transporting ATPase subunit epsilon|nr:ATP synthase F1 subunit epsilon [Actinomycetes bacterium]